MRRATLLVAVVMSFAGCATMNSVLRSNEEERYKAGVQALSTGDYNTAHEQLAWVAEHYSGKAIGQRSLLILAAMEMDPRNPSRRPEVGADLAASFLRLPERDKWVDPVAQTLYLQGLELGVAEDRAEKAEREAQSKPTRDLPKLPVATVDARIKSVEQDRDRLAKRVKELEDQLADKDRELDRIRKTIKP